jgi:hypothetical protein
MNYQDQNGQCFTCAAKLVVDIQGVFEYENGERFTAKVCRKCADSILKVLQ